MAQDWKDMLAAMAGKTEENTPDAIPQAGTPEVGEKKPKQQLHVVIDRKGRKGKVATIIEGFTFDDDAVAEIASELKRKIGTGGSSRGGEILLQGDWKDKVTALLKEKGYYVKS